MNFQPVNFRARSSDHIEREVEYALNAVQAYLSTFKRLRLSPDGLQIVEIGPGSDFAAQLIVASMGANVILADRFLTRFDPGYHATLYAEVAKRWDGPKVQLEAAAEAGHDATNLKLLSEPAEALVSIPDASVDLIYSNAVLEHVVDISAFAREAARITRPGGWGRHQIDWRDHRDFEKPLEHLVMAEDEFRPAAEAVAYEFGNQLRSIEFWAHFEAAGFSVKERQTNWWAQPCYLSDLLPRLRNSNSRYRYWPEDDLRRTSACMLVEKENDAEEDVCRERGADLLSIIEALKAAPVGVSPKLGKKSKQMNSRFWLRLRGRT